MPAAQVRLPGVGVAKEGKKHMRLGSVWWGRLYCNELWLFFLSSRSVYVGFTLCHKSVWIVVFCE